MGVGPENGTLVLDRPLDAWVVVGTDPVRSSLLAVTSSFGSKIFAGNRFNWTEVVQWYGHTIRGVMADNRVADANVKPGGNINVGSMGAVGECYYGPVANCAACLTALRMS